MRLTLPLAALALLAAAAPVAAQTTPPAPTSQAADPHPARAKRPHLSMDTRFQMANTSHDGHLTREQARAASVMHMVAENFDAIDKDHKGFVTEDNIRDWYKARREARRHEKAQVSGAKS
jgi:hypothetical protein